MTNSNLEITEEFRDVFCLLEKTKQSMFITGRAGTGKSTLLKRFIKGTKKNVVLLAPTGIAALNVGGKTINSFFQFPPEIIHKDRIKDNHYSNAKRDIFREIEMIIIDEISMVRVDLIDGIDFVMRQFRNPNKPFGGVQMVFFGDLHQLPPVTNDGTRMKFIDKGSERWVEPRIYFDDIYKGTYFFNYYTRPSWLKDLKYYELTKNFRQNEKEEKEFIKILNAVRENKMSDKLLKTLNKQCTNVFEDEIHLCSKNATADNINSTKLAALQTNEHRYNAILTGSFTEETNRDTKYPAEKELVLKVGAKIMMIKTDASNRWVNGDIGKIIKLGDNEIVVTIKGIDYNVEKENWEDIEYEYVKPTTGRRGKLKTKVVGTFEQFPVRLAWAVTIHKSQGLTFDKIIIDLGDGAFAHGQTYVALSRCRTLGNIKLAQQITYSDIHIDNVVVNFTKKQIAKNKKNVREKIKLAIQKQSILNIFYTDAKGEQSRRTISGIFYKTGSNNKKIGVSSDSKQVNTAFVNFKIENIKRIVEYKL